MRTALRALALGVILLAGCGDPLDPAPEAGYIGDGRLGLTLEHTRDVYALQGLAAMTVFEGEILEEAAVGKRAEGFPDAATVDDTWLIGSLTMSMTATLAGVLVEDGLIDWDTAVGQVFPDLVPSIHSNYVAVTLEELLGHRGALPPDIETAIFESLYDSTDPLPTQRRAWIVELMSQEPSAAGEYSFSYGSYVVAGAMLEEVAGASWESLMQTEIFDPMGMTGAGFGPAWSEGDAQQPHGHGVEGTGFDPSNPERFPAAIGPALGVHLTLADYAAYLIAHMRGELGTDGVVTAATFQKLHERFGASGSYALGWGVAIRGWSPGPVLEHVGAVGGFTTLVWVAPDIELAMFAVTNNYAPQTPTAVDNALQTLLQRFLVP